MNNKLFRREVVSEKAFLLASNKSFAVWILSNTNLDSSIRGCL